MADPGEILADIHALEEELLEFERSYGLRSEIFYVAYRSGEEPEDESWVLDFSEWASVYRTWLMLSRSLSTPGPTGGPRLEPYPV
jgi:hypothetical protein